MCASLFICQVYHVSRNMWFRMETRVVKNVCAPAVVIGDQIIIVGGKGSFSHTLLPAHVQIQQDFSCFLLRMTLLWPGIVRVAASYVSNENH